MTRPSPTASLATPGVPGSHGDFAGLCLGPVQAGASPSEASRELVGAWLKPARGRWLRLALTPAVAAGRLRLVVRGTKGRWPDASVALRNEGDATCGWVFIAEAAEGLQLHGDMQSLAMLEGVSAQLHDAPADESAVPVTMLTAAALFRMGVRGLSEVEFREDHCWPLAATGHDPQLRFLQIDSAARVHVDLQLATDHEAPAAPVLYWANGRDGFVPHASRSLHTGDADVIDSAAARNFSGGLPPLRGGARWRLDPRDTPGRFRIDALRVHTERDVWPPAVQRALDWLLAWRPTRHIHELMAVRDLKPMDGRVHGYIATTDDPQMRLGAPLAAGWYMLELELQLPAARGRARLYLDHGQDDLEANALSLPLRSGQLAKRLLWIPARSRLRLDPTAAPGEFTIRHFRLQRVSRSFAVERMNAKLEKARSGAVGCARRAEGAAAAQHDVAALWQAYCNVFEPRHEGAISYADWIAEVERPAIAPAHEQRREIAGWRFKPVISVITPTYNTPAALLRECLDSVLAQTYPHWELCIADDASTSPEVREVIEAYATREPRVRVCMRERNGHISQASNSAIDLATGDFVALLDHDDTLAPHALFAVVRALQSRPGAQLVYSDEDKLDGDGRRCDPFFKPDWSPDLLRSQNYVSHLGVYRRDLVECVGRFREGYEGSQDYDLLLRCLSRVPDAADVLHVPQVLYHWRKTEGSTAAAHEQKPYATEAARRALQEQADACCSGVRVSVIAPGLYRHRWPIPDPAPVVSLIVPTRDGLDVLRTCIDSIIQRTTYPHYEILVVDNQSSEPESLEYLKDLPRKHSGRVRVLRYDHPFNYSAINNFAVRHAQGSVIGLVNNDIEVISPDWLTEMTSHAIRPDIGCVGAKLYYPDDTVQHGGVVVGLGGVAGHSHKYYARNHPGYCNRLRVVHNVSAVTGAVLLVRKALFEAVGGLDGEHLQVAFNDVDFCLKVREVGFLNLWTPFAELYHHESKTRGADTTPAKQQRFERECEVMRTRWSTALLADPFYSPNLTLAREDYSLRAAPNAVPAAWQSQCTGRDAVELIPEVDADTYRGLYLDLRSMNDEESVRHFRAHGEAEGRTANALADRAAFAACAAHTGRVLEIGPFANPLASGPNVRYCDVRSQEELRTRAKALGLDAHKVPTIHYVLDKDGLGSIDEHFDAVLSSHSVEHQPDLVAHLQQIERIVGPNRGRYFLLVPDKRYCFDHFIAESTIADVLQAHEERRTVHTLRSVIEHRALTTHNDAARHWNEPTAARQPINAEIVRAAVDEWRRAQGAYIDVHAWYFTPQSFATIVSVLNALGHVGLAMERLYASRRGSNEFWAVLRAGGDS